MKFLWVFLLALCPAHAVTVAVLDTKVEDCREAKMTVEALKNVPGYPREWHVYLACNVVVWKSVTTRMGVQGTDTAFTSVDGHFTVLNAYVVFDVNRPTYGTNPPENILRHELGHIRCNCGSEKKANEAGQAVPVNNAE